MDEEWLSRMERQLEPGNTVRLLNAAGIFLLLYELLLDTIVTDVKGFFADEFDDELMPVRSAAYETEVIKGVDGELLPCLDWLRAHGVVDVDDVKSVARLRKERHRVAHEVDALLVDPDFQVDVDLLDQAGVVLRKIEVFFGRIVVECNAEFDDRDIADADIQSGRSVLFDHVMLFRRGLAGRVAGGPAPCRACVALGRRGWNC